MISFKLVLSASLVSAFALIAKAPDQVKTMESKPTTLAENAGQDPNHAPFDIPSGLIPDGLR